MIIEASEYVIAFGIEENPKISVSVIMALAIHVFYYLFITWKVFVHARLAIVEEISTMVGLWATIYTDISCDSDFFRTARTTIAAKQIGLSYSRNVLWLNIFA